MYTIGFTTVTFRALSRGQVCALAAKTGATAIEWGGDVHLPPCDGDALGEVTALHEKYGLKAISYGSYYKLGMRDFKLFEKISDTAAAIGAQTIRVWQGEKPSCEVSDAEFSEMVAETSELSEIAAAKKLNIAFEFHKGTNNDCGDAAIKFLRAVNRPNVGTYWQPLGCDKDEENLEKVLPYLTGVHVFHWTRSGRRLALKRGSEQWKRYASIVKSAGAETNYIMEFVKGDKPKRFEKDFIALGAILGEVYGR